MLFYRTKSRMKGSLDTVSESQTRHKCRLARVIATLIRRRSARKPTCRVVFEPRLYIINNIMIKFNVVKDLRTRDITTASFSPP